MPVPGSKRAKRALTYALIRSPRGAATAADALSWLQADGEGKVDELERAAVMGGTE